MSMNKYLYTMCLLVNIVGAQDVFAASAISDGAFEKKEAAAVMGRVSTVDSIGDIKDKGIQSAAKALFEKGCLKESFDASYSADHPVSKAVRSIKDPALQIFLRDYCHTYKRVIDPIVEFLYHETKGPDGVPNPESILDVWKSMSAEERPMFYVQYPGGISLEEMKSKAKEMRDKEGKPFMVSDDYHVAVARFSYADVDQKLSVEFWDPYAASKPGSFMEKEVRNILEGKVYPECDGTKTTVTAHYTKHQPLTAFGDCSLYARFYEDLLVVGLDPAVKSNRFIAELIQPMKDDECRAPNAAYFEEKYDPAFQFAFDSGFSDALAKEIRALPAGWGIE